MTGLSRSNLHYMRQMAATWPAEEIVQQPVGQLPWGHVTVLLDKLPDRAARDWYAARAAEGGWSRRSCSTRSSPTRWAAPAGR
jgi:predicted nuclease of restriction endonuclease-like (RecB) superfamily